MEEIFCNITGHMNSWNIGIIKKSSFSDTSIPMIIWIFEGFEWFNGFFSSKEFIIRGNNIFTANTFKWFFYPIFNIMISFFFLKKKKKKNRLMNIYF